MKSCLSEFLDFYATTRDYVLAWFHMMEELLLGTDNLRTFAVGENTEELFCSAKELLPLDSNDYKISVVKGNASCFRAEVKLKLRSSEDIVKFVADYSLLNEETLTKKTPKKYSGKGKYTYVIYYRCQHWTTHCSSYNPKAILTKRPSKRIKNTDCPFSLNFKILRDGEFESDLCCAMVLEWNHNYPVKSLQARA